VSGRGEIPDGGANDAILAQGGRFGGWSLYMKDGKHVDSVLSAGYRFDF